MQAGIMVEIIHAMVQESQRWQKYPSSMQKHPRDGRLWDCWTRMTNPLTVSWRHKSTAFWRLRPALAYVETILGRGLNCGVLIHSCAFSCSLSVVCQFGPARAEHTLENHQGATEIAFALFAPRGWRAEKAKLTRVSCEIFRTSFSEYKTGSSSVD
jgi:hypothetical protein